MACNTPTRYRPARCRGPTQVLGQQPCSIARSAATCLSGHARARPPSRRLSFPHSSLSFETDGRGRRPTTAGISAMSVVDADLVWPQTTDTGVDPRSGAHDEREQQLAGARGVLDTDLDAGEVATDVGGLDVVYRHQQPVSGRHQALLAGTIAFGSPSTARIAQPPASCQTAACSSSPAPRPARPCRRPAPDRGRVGRRARWPARARARAVGLEVHQVRLVAAGERVGDDASAEAYRVGVWATGPPSCQMRFDGHGPLAHRNQGGSTAPAVARPEAEVTPAPRAGRGPGPATPRLA